MARADAVSAGAHSIGARTRAIVTDPAMTNPAPTPSPTRSAEPVRRGWRERIEPGVYRMHRLACPASADHRPGRRCPCAYQVLVPGRRPGTSATLTITGTLTAARAARRARQAAGRPVAPTTPRDPGTLRELARAWLHTRAPVLSPNTIADAEVDYRLRIDPALGHLPLDEVNRRCVEGFVAELVGAGAGPRMLRSAVSTLRRILGAGVEWDLIETNPAARIRLPAANTHAEQAVERVLDRTQLERLVAAAGSVWAETMIRTLGEAGLRRGELIGLRWADVDLAARRLYVRRGVVQVGGLRTERTTKGRRARKAAISGALAERLAAWYAEAVVQDGAAADGYVWPGRGGRAMNAHSPNQALARALRRAGLVDDEGVALVSPHGLRHTAASLMLAAGVPLIVVSRQLGHANPNITAQVYAHLLGDEQLDQAAACFEDRDEPGGMRAGADAPHPPGWTDERGRDACDDAFGACPGDTPVTGRARGRSEGRLKVVVSPVRIWVPPSTDPARPRSGLDALDPMGRATVSSTGLRSESSLGSSRSCPIGTTNGWDSVAALS